MELNHLQIRINESFIDQYEYVPDQYEYVTYQYESVTD